MGNRLAIGARFRRFLRDDSGVGTIWALMWLILMFGLGGLAVDITIAFQHRTALQATADASALAGAIDLPVNEFQTNDPVVISAVDYAFKNMKQEVHGTVLTPWEVVIGDWDAANKAMKPKAGEFPTAVMVTTRRDDVNQNPVGLTFLRILAMFGDKYDRWNVRTQAVAERFIPECLTKQGLIARGTVDYQSNNVYKGNFCMHGENAVKVSNNNDYYPGVVVSAIDKQDIKIGNANTLDTSDWSSNEYLDFAGQTTGTTVYEHAASERMDPKMVDYVNQLMNTFLDPALDNLDTRTNIVNNDAYLPYLQTDLSTGLPKIVEVDFKTFNEDNGWKYGKSSQSEQGEGIILHVTGCEGHHGNHKITIGDNNAKADNPLRINDMAIITDCIIDHTAYVYYSNVVLASRWENKQISNDNIKFAGDDVLGHADACQPGGGMLILSTQTVTSPAQLSLHGVQAVVAGDIELAAKANGINGVHFQAGGNISITSNEAMGAIDCDDGIDPLITADYWRLVY